jgi:hypothetical protein
MSDGDALGDGMTTVGLPVGKPD